MTRMMRGVAAMVSTLRWFVVSIYRSIEEDDVSGVAAEMAYRFLFAAFPLLLFLSTSLGFIGRFIGMEGVFENVLTRAEVFLPSTIAVSLRSVATNLLNDRSGSFLSVGLIGTIWGAAGGVGALAKGFDRAYGIDRRAYVLRRALAIGLTLLLPFVAVALLIASSISQALLVGAGSFVGISGEVAAILDVLRWPVSIAVLFVAISAIYALLPSIRRRYFSVLPGSAVATLGWIAAAELVGLYLANFGHYNATYGSFGAAMAFLLWLYVAAMLLLIGVEVNVVFEGSASERRLSDRPVDQYNPSRGQIPPRQDRE